MGVLLAFAACLSTAGAAILQSIGARQVRTYAAVDVRLFVALVRNRPYVTGLVLDLVSFVCTVAALHDTPLFVVQAIVAASIAVIAGVSVRLHDRRLGVAEWTAVGAICVGIGLLVASQEPRVSLSLPNIGGWALLAAPVLTAVVAVATVRARTGAAFPGLLAGLMFGDSAVATRVIARLGEPAASVLLSPSGIAVIVSGALGTLLYANAVQRGSVTAASAMSTVGQTLGPALTGWFVLGDGIRSAFVWAAVTGFVLTVGAAVTLAHHAHPAPAGDAEGGAGLPEPPHRLLIRWLGRVGRRRG